jgi:hypothetical protein
LLTSGAGQWSPRPRGSTAGAFAADAHLVLAEGAEELGVAAREYDRQLVEEDELPPLGISKGALALATIAPVNACHALASFRFLSVQRRREPPRRRPRTLARGLCFADGRRHNNGAALAGEHQERGR